MQYRIWAIRSNEQLGEAADWLKDKGRLFETDNLSTAFETQDRYNIMMNNKFATAQFTCTVMKSTDGATFNPITEEDKIMPATTTENTPKNKPKPAATKPKAKPKAKPDKPAAPAPKADKPPTKIDIVRNLFAKATTVTREELCNKSGFDERNLSAYLTILMNEQRTKPGSLFFTVYDKATKSYTVVKSAAERAKIIAARKTEPESK